MVPLQANFSLVATSHNIFLLDRARLAVSPVSSDYAKLTGCMEVTSYLTNRYQSLGNKAQICLIQKCQTIALSFKKYSIIRKIVKSPPISLSFKASRVFSIFPFHNCPALSSLLPPDHVTFFSPTPVSLLLPSSFSPPNTFPLSKLQMAEVTTASGAPQCH